MARIGITYEQVAAAADVIIGEGQQPTINAVRDRIGTGSPNTVHRHLTAWRAARPQAKVAVPELSANLTSAIATEIERAAANARAEVESKLVQAQAEAAELANAGEALEVKRDELLEQVVEITTERDTLGGKAEQQEIDIKTLTGRIEREQQAAESARVELAKAQLKIDVGNDKLTKQTAEIDWLRSLLDGETKGRIAAEQQVAVLGAKLESMTDRATKADSRVEQVEQQSEQIKQEINGVRNQAQAQQAELNITARALDDARLKLKEAKSEAKKATEEAAELRGQLKALTEKAGKLESKPKTPKRTGESG